MFRFRQILDPDDLRSLFVRVRLETAGQPALTVLLDASDVQLVPGDARRLLLDELTALPVTAVALIGAEFPMRVLLLPILHVVRVEGALRHFDCFDDEDSALRWSGELVTAPAA